MSRSPTLRTAALITAVLLVLGVACWWDLRRGPKPTEDMALCGPEKVRSGMRSSCAAGHDSAIAETMGVVTARGEAP